MTSGADLLLHGGTVWTGLPRAGGVLRSTAVAVGGGRVLALGAAAEALREPRTEVIDLDGGTLLPGFGDGHAHPLFAGAATLFAPIQDQPDVAGVVAAVAGWAAAHPEAAWVRGEGYDPALAPAGEFDARWLDAVVPDRPVVLRASDYHTAWVNSAALDRAGITNDTPDPPDGVIVRRPDGSALGTLREWGAWRPVYDLLPPLTDGDRIAAARHAARTYAAVGVTWVQDAWVEADGVAGWLAAADAGVLTLRADLALLAEPGEWRDLVPRLRRTRSLVEERAGDALTARTVKFFADGVVEGATAALLEPYCDCPHSRGLPGWDRAELAEAVTAVVAAGFRPHVHAIGDAAVRHALDAFDAAIRVAGTAGRPVVAHCQLVDPDDLARFAELGAVANVEPLWAQQDACQVELTLPRLGRERADRQYPLASLLSAGAVVSFGSDWPVTAPDPLAGIAVAMTRQTADGQPPGGWVPEQRITLDQALTAATSGVAYQAGEEGRWGVVAPDARADLVWVGADLAALDPGAVARAPVLGTWLAGRRVH